MRSLTKVLAGVLLTLLVGTGWAGTPHAAYYSSDNDKILWFIVITDLHIGASGNQDSNSLAWVVSKGKEVVDPEFIMATGDLTDCTAGGGSLALFFGPYQSEWNEYKSILAGAGMNATNYYDIPGNHDAYSDQYFAYYLANSIQGQANGYTQVSWTREFSYGKYHFLGVNTADNSGDGFSLAWPWGDFAGLDSDELTYIQNQLVLHEDADLTIVFGHHPVTDTGVWNDTWLYYGAETFVELLDQYGASSYDYGHTHDYSEMLFTGATNTGYMTNSGVIYLNTSTLGKTNVDNFTVIAIDCNGISSKTTATNAWPMVLVTTPVNYDLGGVTNPYAYRVPVAPNNPIRALVFDSNTISQVRYRIDGDAWYAMQQVSGNSRLWEASWNNSGSTEGEVTLEVQATGSSVKSDIITVYIDPALSDADADDIPDWWEYEHGGTNLLAGGTNDYDEDGMPDSDEYVADTDPTNSTSLLRTGALSSDASGFTIWWPSATGRYYAVFKTADLLEGWPETPLTNLYWGDASGSNVFYDADQANGTVFYRIEAHLP